MKTKPAVALLNATVLVVSKDGKSGLLIKPSKRRKSWELPGGKIDRRESLPAGAVREVLEETGIRVRLEAMTALYKCSRQDGLYFVFIGREEGGELRPEPGEISKVNWFPLESITASIKCGLNRQRIEDCLNFSGSPMYRLVRRRPYELIETWDLGPSSLDSLGFLEDLGDEKATSDEQPDEVTKEASVDRVPTSAIWREAGHGLLQVWRLVKRKLGGTSAN
ncbi:MAG: NUDIX hydrolase [Verrucomicrobiales bacterium]|nr:NUDIX hydrolase [Verrucomicrobiales bacterium]